MKKQLSLFIFIIMVLTVVALRKYSLSGGQAKRYSENAVRTNTGM